MKWSISRVEVVVLVLVFLSIAAGFIIFFIDKDLFFRQEVINGMLVETGYVSEDRLVEWLSVMGLLCASFVCFQRFFKLRKVKPAIFLVIAFLFGIVLFFAAGEEISWGQRLFGLKSPEYFQQNNTQGETNLHNLVLGGVRLNRWIFSVALTVVMSLYIVIVPLLYRKKKWMKNLVDTAGIPLPKPYQIIVFLVLFVITELLPDGKRAELLELGTAWLLFLIVTYPYNRNAFQSVEKLRS